MSQQPPAIDTRNRVIIGSVLVAVVVIACGFWWWAANRKGVEFTAVFSASVGVYPGSDVRMLGVSVGTVDSVTPTGSTVRIGMHLDPGRDAAADTEAVIINPNLVADRYVQLTAPWVGGAKLAGGTTIPVTRTHTPVEIDDLYRSLTSLSEALGPDGANSKGALNRLLAVGAQNLDGNGAEFNAAITGLSTASKTLSVSKDDIFGTVDNLQKFAGMLAKNDANLRSVNTNLKDVAATFAADRQSFADAMKYLAAALGQVQTFIHDNRNALTTEVGKLNTVAATLAARRDSVLKLLSAAPLLAQNFLNAYDPQDNVIRGRADLNELTVWANSAGSSAADGASADGGSAPAGLLPAANVSTPSSAAGGRK